MFQPLKKKKKNFINPLHEIVGHLIWAKIQQPQEQHYLFLLVYTVFFVHIQIMVWLPEFGVFNVRAHVDACNCTQGKHCRRVCTES